MASVTQLGYVGINAKDVDKWESFATNTLGLQVSGKEKKNPIRPLIVTRSQN